MSSLADKIVLVLQDPAASYQVSDAIIEAEGEVVHANNADDALSRLSAFEVDAAVLEAFKCNEKLVDALISRFIPSCVFGSGASVVRNAVIVEDVTQIVPALLVLMRPAR